MRTLLVRRDFDTIVSWYGYEPGDFVSDRFLETHAPPYNDTLEPLLQSLLALAGITVSKCNCVMPLSSVYIVFRRNTFCGSLPEHLGEEDWRHAITVIVDHFAGVAGCDP